MTRKELINKICAAIGEEIQAEMVNEASGPPMGFCLLIFDPEHCATASNLGPEDEIKLLRAHVAHLEGVTN